ncbi:valine--pyruvate transaminase [Limnobaculum parvum]|uniref:Valine--pyruvate transaminase n=1 Tax=Limnobaculum parvum TaxID=2172103 RepID=A0A2Y9TZ45_9GAMM|nr:valine--pyruvate transaminase [Limnobaculum parvum]AWH88955.1 valine--pyruvate transaminase [Limnobaculum parvum]
MVFSSFGKKFTRFSGITQLMSDLNEGLRTPGAIMLGGGNPAKIPEMQDYFTQLCTDLLAEGKLTESICNYDGPQGKNTFLTALAEMLSKELGWPIEAKNIALTNGSQSAFFYLFNLFAGHQPNGQVKKILFPLAPEYIGYADVGLEEDLLISYKPTIELLPEGMFKYHIDFDHLNIGDDIGAICVSRPTNPTGNVLTDEEVMRLDAIAHQKGIPLIIDNAYGVPFPGIIFSQATPLWNFNTILCMSLSKLGLPGTRCGIVIANEETIQAISNMNGIISLAPGSIGPALALEMIERGDLLRLSEQVIRPFYQQRVAQTLAIIRRYIPAERCLIHKPEGAIFLWLWFKDLPISSQTLYLRLKARGVLMVPGHYFFPGLEQAWPHTQQCMRMNYVPEPELIEKGIIVLAEEIEKAHRENCIGKNQSRFV